MNTTDTICAIATGAAGAIAIIRIAGPEALKTGSTVWRGRGGPEPRRMTLGRIAVTGDTALAVYMPGPHSYTGDDVFELHLHGGILNARRTLEACASAGARLAEPGEFTFRAFVNGKLDLAQAEAVGDLISAGSDVSLRLAANQLSGALSARIAAIRAGLTDILGDAESRLDFPEEHIDWEDAAALAVKLADAAALLKKLAATFQTGRCFRDGVKLVLAGRPNVGKSSLLNALLGRDRAIVTPIAGTTRDTIEETAVLRRIPVRITDTAGLRDDVDAIEAIGIERSLATLRESEIVFWLLDAARPETDMSELAEVTAPVVAVWNKCDLPHGELPELPYPSVKISAAQHDNFEELLDAFERAVWRGAPPEPPDVAVNERQFDRLNRAREAAMAAIPEIEKEYWELAAAQLRLAVDALGEITGETASVDILDNIFSRFCIGK